MVGMNRPKPKRIVRLAVIKNERRADEARYVRHEMFKYARSASNARGDDLSGFVLMTWDREGHIRTAIDTGYGPFSACMLPNQLRDALQRHIGSSVVDVPLDKNPEDGAS